MRGGDESCWTSFERFTFEDCDLFRPRAPSAVAANHASLREMDVSSQAGHSPTMQRSMGQHLQGGLSTKSTSEEPNCAWRVPHVRNNQWLRKARLRGACFVSRKTLAPASDAAADFLELSSMVDSISLKLGVIRLAEET